MIAPSLLSSDFARLAEQHFPDPRGLVTLGVSLSEVFGQPGQLTLDELALARERGYRGA